MGIGIKCCFVSTNVSTNFRGAYYFKFDDDFEKMNCEHNNVFTIATVIRVLFIWPILEHIIYIFLHTSLIIYRIYEYFVICISRIDQRPKTNPSLNSQYNFRLDPSFHFTRDKWRNWRKNIVFTIQYICRLLGENKHDYVLFILK